MVGLSHRKIFRSLYQYRFVFLAVLTVAILGISFDISARPLSVRINRWLELQSLSGAVQFLQDGQWSQAQQGQRLGRVGEGVRTGSGSLARLAVDTQIGFVSVSENTELEITDLYTTSRGGKVTKLKVNRGQARMFVRRFTNPESSFEMITPAGVNGVRGTDFGVLTQPSGCAALAVLTGAVESAAQGEAVPVDENFQNLTCPGEPPSLPEPLSDDTDLDVFRLERQNRQEDQTLVLFQGHTSPYNLLVIEGETQEVGREGDFNLLLSLPGDEILNAKVITTLGTQQVYDLAVP